MSQFPDTAEQYTALLHCHRDFADTVDI